MISRSGRKREDSIVTRETSDTSLKQPLIWYFKRNCSKTETVAQRLAHQAGWPVFLNKNSVNFESQFFMGNKIYRPVCDVQSII